MTSSRDLGRGLPKGTSAIKASVAGLMTPKVFPDSEGTHLPSTNIAGLCHAGSVASLMINLWGAAP